MAEREISRGEWTVVNDGRVVQPVLVEVPDGFYTSRIVLDGPLLVGQFPEGTTIPTDMVPYHYEPCRIPRTRRELRWAVV